MRAHAKVFRFLVLLALVWSVAMFYTIYSGMISNVKADDATSPERIHREFADVNFTSELLLGRFSMDESLVKQIAMQISKHDPMKDLLASMLNLSSPQVSPIQSEVGQDFNDQSRIFRAMWPPVASPTDDGYGGAGVIINPATLNPREKVIYDNGYSTYKVNQLASDRIPLRREIHINMPECKVLQYDTASLPKVGIVLIFHNELWSVLLRTVFSILDAGPDHLITEIVLVDDASDKEFLGTPLENYLKIFGGKVKLVRLPARKGLIEARLTGYEHVTAPIAAFLDAHCEVHKGWLEPLLQRIKEDDTVLAVPNTDRLNWDTFQYEFKDNSQHERGGFDFDMNYNWIRPPPPPDGVERKTWADPVKSPTHLGCCFAVSKKNFDRLGRYDPGLDIWGCENLELSFKTWMCGGRVELIPCSHVGHMYRPSFPYSWGSDGQYKLQRNCLRVAEVWLDEYKKVYHERISDLQKSIDIGDTRDRKAIRDRLKCRPFEWYAKEIYPELYIPLNTSATGRIASAVDPALCMSRDVHWPSLNQSVLVTRCNSGDQNQHFFLSKEGHIRRDQGCLVYDRATNQVVMRYCEHADGHWIYTQDDTLMAQEVGQCFTLSPDKKKVFMATCNVNNPSQKWKWPRKSVIFQAR